MRDFIFHNPVKIYFGKGQARHIAQEVERVEGAVLVVYGGGSIKRNGAYDDVMAALAGTGRKIIELPGVTPNPRLDKALEGVRLVKEHGVGLILAVGGGSVIDCAKFISLGSGIGDDEDLWDDYIETGKPAPEGLIPVGVVLTTAATGSEMGDAAVLTNWERNRKLGYTSFPLMPRFSVLDPSYLMTLPAEQTVYGFEDMFCHTCEQYFSYPVDDNLSDEIAEGIQRHILRSWRACLSDPKDYGSLQCNVGFHVGSEPHYLARQGRGLGDARHRARAVRIHRYRSRCWSGCGPPALDGIRVFGQR